ncbi:MAG: response regulator [Spirochaetes bacterium]|nr:response regulator [Spirochaetota bacterium]
MDEIKEILLVEDDSNDVELTLTALSEYNLSNNIKVVRDGEEALDYLFKEGKYDNLMPGNPAVILLDLNMPKIGGLEVLRRVRTDDKLKFIPIVILTSSREEKDIVESYKLGVNAYVVKPVDFQQFIEAIKKLGMFWALFNEPPPGSIHKTH